MYVTDARICNFSFYISYFLNYLPLVKVKSTSERRYLYQWIVFLKLFSTLVVRNYWASVLGDSAERAHIVLIANSAGLPSSSSVCPSVSPSVHLPSNCSDTMEPVLTKTGL